MNKEKLLDIFSRINKEEKPINLHSNSKILLIDGMNTFLRGFSSVSKMNLLGHEVGGIVGFLRSIGHAIKILSPTRVIIVFDGEAGSSGRKNLYSNYKANRDNSRMMNYKSFNNKEEEDESKYDQIVRLIDYLKYLPVSIISIDRLEADDIIGYLSGYIEQSFDDSETYIMSTDNDYLQLVNDRTKVYNPTKKKIYHVESVLEEFNAHPSNFLLYKVLVGDDSDNIPGVSGLGKKNTPELFEFIKEPKENGLEKLYEVCNDPPKKSVLYNRVLNTTKQVEIFYKIMNLKNPNVSEEEQNEIKNYFHQKTNGLKKFDFIKLYNNDKMGDVIPYLDTWLNVFSVLNNF